MSDFEFMDALCVGSVSRRQFMERIAAAGAGATLLTASVLGQQKPQPDAENIGGGGRLERNFYRDWIRKSKVPMVEGYSIYDARDQEALPWPEIGGKGLYLNFSGNVHMDGVIVEIPGGKSLVPRSLFYEQLIVVLAGRGHTMVGSGPKANKVSWGEGSLFS